MIIKIYLIILKRIKIILKKKNKIEKEEINEFNWEESKKIDDYGDKY